jgi:glycosyltransferase involved in cell wall biosynthesis
MTIVFDATNIGEGGGLTHLKEILSFYNHPYKIILIAQDKIKKQIPDYNFLVKKTHQSLNKTLFHRLYFQIFLIDKLIPKDAIVYSITGDFLGRHKPLVSMSTNMLLYERKIWKEIKNFKEIARFWVNYHKQKISFKNSNGLIFISQYAKNYISNHLNLKNKNIKVIHHGVSHRFLKELKVQKNISLYSFTEPFKFIYVSTIHVYKNQCNVVEAINLLRKKGYPVELNIVGAVIFTPAGKKLESTIKKIDPSNKFIYNHGHIPYEKIDQLYNNMDGIIFASTCENMPNILMESMLTGIPIACSEKEPMPEFLKENGFYFNAKIVNSIEESLIEFLNSPEKRTINASNALSDALKYSWKETNKDIIEFLISNYENVKK